MAGLVVGEALDPAATLFRAADLATGAPRLVKLGAAAQIAGEASTLAQQTGLAGVVRLVDQRPFGHGQAALVTDLIEGVSLAQIIAAGALPWNPAVRIALAFAKILGAVHARGIIHGGVRPSHLMLSGQGPVVFGFEAAVALGAPYQAGAAQGTWAAPQARVAALPAAPDQDVYALAAVLSGLLGGSSPGGLAATGEALSSPDLPAALAEWLTIALGPRAPGRRGTMAEFSAGLAVVLAGGSPCPMPMPLPTSASSSS
ncbi:MAG: hypothetical protein LBU05_02375, partial [Bifidobacteriaceae bacterium]|nr:hypothetical protein [Bifidobacteriaceae bacterium]